MNYIGENVKASKLFNKSTGKIKDELIPSGSGGAAWGGITGTLANQTDLQTALDGKLPKAVPTAEQGSKEYLYSFAGETQNTDIAVTNDMRSGEASYTDRMVPTSKSVAILSGGLENLETTDKDSLVDAINEVKGETDTLADALNAKVDKVVGKGLSTNDYDDTEKAAVAANTTARHTHSNKTELDLIASGDKDKWDAMYTKPNGGIPKTDLASAVQTSLELADTALQSHQDISGKQDKTPIVTPASASSYEIAVDSLTNLGTLTSAITLTLATAPSDNKAHVYAFTFTAGSTVPTITWPSGISWAGGSAPTITTGKSYEVSIMSNLAVVAEF